VKIRVRCFTGMRRYAPDDKADFPLEMTEGATVRELLETLQIPADPWPFIAVNAQKVEANGALHDGDDVVMFTPMEGG
jgi:molybdopterin converting factor small subunit